MALRRKFTFELPEDSYWNESDSNSSGLFDDLQSKQLQARAAVDNLFGGDETPKPYVRPQNPTPTPTNVPLQIDGRAAAVSDKANIRITDTSPRASGKIVDDFLNMKFAENVNVAPVIQTAPSVVSEASASSLPSEAQRLDLDYNRLRQEHRKLKDQHEVLRHERFQPLTIEASIKRMLQGHTVTLDYYRSLRDKTQLLKQAVATYDNNTIFKIVIFLERTLKENIFCKIMDGQKSACRVYTRHLQITGEWDKMNKFLRSIGQYQHASVIEFEATRKYKRNPDKRVPLLRTMLHGSFSIPEMKFEARQMEALMRNYEIQLQMEKMDAGDKGEHFRKFPKTSSLIGLPALSSLYYSAMYHYDDSPTSAASLPSVQTLIRFNDRLATQTIVSALTRLSRWPDIDKLLQPKTITMTFSAAKSVFKGKKSTSKWGVSINNHNLLTIVKRSHPSPPTDFIYRILKGESDAQERLRLALLFDVPEMVIECLTQKGDRLSLASYAKSLKTNSVESFKAVAALNNPSIKWK
ncbi:Spermatogenesis-defective protein 39 [Caenorhabditis elegans]|uniref:Spermatogenesis-defective protein 39 n=1 Tax=Caenorhabditis elegans TaxID=6239 RepID=SPE39_CAEEL|nr:Spermatogenesis-defective protein 39 [Caenorhabditis elegans]Q23288.1 RecName: Full=Spermatogenesis-defective protein 39; Short=SPE-39; AltName: Full=VPS33B-interacting protein in polarity and apical restriction [Caenorhabditis elegans]CCD72490.1 Spermatogenesis-defective protein 39 [Caenorhabditis elegans]|eukprot:NP_504718.1 Spermatogenesis-defective protein 39 [Caenorhabditis elegans]